MPFNMHVTIHSGPDSEKRYEYTVNWDDPDTGKRRGQVFHAPLADCMNDSCAACLQRNACDAAAPERKEEKA
jgi:hypothetical protein